MTATVVAFRDVETLVCSKCKQVKPVAEFGVKKRFKRGYDYHCKPCARAEGKRLQQKWRDTHPFYHREKRLKNWYRMTHADYLEMLHRQHGGCAICKRPPAENEVLHVDHDHSSSPGLRVRNHRDVRGLLCQTCNRAIGFFKDSPIMLRSAAEYLENHNSRSPGNRQ